MVQIIDKNFKHFLEHIFKKYIYDVSQYDYNLITELNVQFLHIRNLQGIENFTNLKILDCGYNFLTEIDLSCNLYLENINCQFNQLKKLDLSQNINLKTVICNNNFLPELNIMNNINLEYLDCSYNQLKKLDISKNIHLKILNYQFNCFIELDVSKNKKLIDENSKKFIETLFNKPILKISQDDYNSITEIICASSKIEILQGIKNFKSRIFKLFL